VLITVMVFLLKIRHRGLIKQEFVFLIASESEGLVFT